MSALLVLTLLALTAALLAAHTARTNADRTETAAAQAEQHMRDAKHAANINARWY